MPRRPTTRSVTARNQKADADAAPGGGGVRALEKTETDGPYAALASRVLSFADADAENGARAPVAPFALPHTLVPTRLLTTYRTIRDGTLFATERAEHWAFAPAPAPVEPPAPRARALLVTLLPPLLALLVLAVLWLAYRMH